MRKLVVVKCPNFNSYQYVAVAVAVPIVWLGLKGSLFAKLQSLQQAMKMLQVVNRSFPGQNPAKSVF